MLAAMLTVISRPPSPPAAPPTTTPATRAARRLEDYQLPMLPREEVRRIDALLIGAERRRRRATRELDLVNELCRITIGGIVDGTLAMTTEASRTSRPGSPVARPLTIPPD